MLEFLKRSNFVVLILYVSFGSVLNISSLNDGVRWPDLDKAGALLPERKILHRKERDADAENNVTLKVNDLNDTHQQLIVHWVGEGSSIIICLARDSKENIRRVKQPSSVYYSYDYGETFDNKSDRFEMPNGTLLQLDKFYIHSKYSSRTVFVDSTNKMLFITEDHGKTFKSQTLDFVPSEISFLPSSPRIFLAHDKSNPSRKLYITQDFGNTLTLLQEYVKSFDWFSEDGSDQKYLIVQREELNGASIVLKVTSSNRIFLKPDLDVILTSVNDLSVKGDFVFATKNSTENGSFAQQQQQQNKELFIKCKSGPFIKATFNADLARKDYHIADITDNRILVAVHHTETLSNLYVSDIITEKTQAIHFRLSLERIFCYFPNGTWRTSLISGLADTSFADLHKVEGLRGIYIASQVSNSIGNSSSVTPEHMVTKITFNWGTTWNSLNVTHQLSNSSNCQPEDSCSLHLSQKFALWHPMTRVMPILSSKSAPGLIIATGVYGKSMKGHTSVFVSRDAGITWRQVLKENAYFNIGDHGGIIVAIKFSGHQKQKDDPFQIMYSTDMGETWRLQKVANLSLRVYSLMTEPGENTTVFSLFGSPPGAHHHWIIVKADFQKVFSYNCTEDDYKFWSPYNPNEEKMNCLLGRKEVYKKRIPHSNCYNGLNFDQPVKIQLCPCNSEDFVCDDGFYEDEHTRHCIRNKTIAKNPYDAPKNCPPYSYFKRTKGYKKISGDSCEGGPRQYLYDTVPCPIQDLKEFLLLAQKDRIVMFKLDDPKPDVLPITGLQNVIAVEYDMENKCVFYADIVSDIISKWCLGGSTLPKSIVDSRLHSVEGMAFDWISKHLYFVDGVRGKIEVIRTDVEDSNRYRKTVINSTVARKPRGIAVHPVAGYMFWTDWVAGAPSINRANLDGSNPVSLFTKPTVEWPNGITVDFIAERIYWVDAKEDYIASADFYGHMFKKIIEHDPKVSHPFSVAVFKDNMYWDDWRANTIFVADKDHGLAANIVASQLPGLMDLKIYAHSIQDGTNGCAKNRSNCSHMCFGLPGNKTSCQCPDDLILVDGHKCVCPGGHEPLANGTCLPVQNTCSSNYFRCSNGVCIPSSLKCDGDNDCGDNSDETCENVTATCEPNKFRCGNGKCILSNWKCDHDFDCPDHSDEIGCHYPTCKANQFSCDNGRCIAVKWRCDNENDCRDGSDERNCTLSPPAACQADEFACSPGKSAQCIPATWQCDNEPDCPDGLDEASCSDNRCDYYQFQCKNNKCIFATWRCDGDNDCGDSSDEVNCTGTAGTVTPPSIAPPPGFPCTRLTFSCLDHKTCIPVAWKCDGVRDCSDGSDEFGCSPEDHSMTKPNKTSKPTVTPWKSTTSFVCAVNEFMCTSGHCIPQAYLCDRREDCANGEDEKYCDGYVECKTDDSQFKCRKTGICIDVHQVCDGNKDCPDGSDEGLCGKTAVTVPPVDSCHNGFFKCDEIRCEPLHKKCDGRLDCQDEADEHECTSLMNKTFQATDLKVDRLSDDSMVVSWSVQPSSFLSASKLEYLPSIMSSKNGNNNSWVNETNWINDTYYRFVNLTAYTTYTVTIYVRNAELNKVYPTANYRIVTTRNGVPSPPINIRYRISNNSYISSNIEVTWSPPEQPRGEILQYIVRLEPPNPPLAVTVSGNSRKAMLAYALQNDTEYTVTVIAKNELYESTPSAPATFRFENIVSKNDWNLKADKPAYNSVTLSWHRQLVGLVYDITITSNDKYPVLKPRSTNETQYTVTGLSPGVSYVFEVSVAGSKDREPAKVKATTLGSQLPVVPHFSVDVNGTAVNMSWDAPKEKKKTKYKYAVYVAVSQFELLRAPKRETDETYMMMYDLPPCGSYLFDVGVIQSMNAEESYGPLTNEMKSAITGIDPKAMPQGLNISQDSSAEPNITIVWHSSCDIVNTAIGYVVNIVEVNTKESYAVTVNDTKDTTFRHVFGAKFGCKYNISVSTTAPNARVNWIEFETLQQIPTPNQVSAYPKTDKGFIVQWDDKKNGALKNLKYKYEILVHEGIKFDVDGAKVYTAGSPPVTISDVKDDQVYMVAVRIVTHDGRRSQHSQPQTVKKYSSEPSTEQLGNEEKSGGFMWLIIVCVIVACSTTGFVYWRRKRSHLNSFKNLANSHYNTRSGSTTFTGVNGLDMDDSPDIREHFSDDEPLVIA